MSRPRQLTLDEAIAAGRRAIDQVERNADSNWIAAARRLVRQYLETHPELHVDAWWEWAHERGLETPRESRALGAVFRYAAQARWMRKSGRARPSVRSRGGEKPVWTSLIQSEGGPR